jgi:predicted dehydrogenase
MMHKIIHPIDKILIVGTGTMAKKHLDIIRKSLPDSQIFLYSEREKSNFSIPALANGLFYTAQEAIRFDPQVTVIANAASHHLHITNKLACLNSHFLIEKPLTDSPDKILQIDKNLQHKNRIIQIGYNLRFSDVLVKFKELISHKLLGSILSVRSEVGQYLPDWRPAIDYRDSVSAQKALGGGALLELSHELDYLRWIFGDCESLSAYVNRASALEVDVEDQAILKMKLKDFWGAKNHSYIATLHMDFYRRDPVRKCTVIGSKATLTVDQLKGEICLFHENSWESLFKNECSLQETYLKQWNSFVECIQYNKQPRVSLEDAAEVIWMIETAKKSHAKNSIFISLPSFGVKN